MMNRFLHEVTVSLIFIKEVMFVTMLEVHLT
jgi:hypothetical protein